MDTQPQAQRPLILHEAVQLFAVFPVLLIVQLLTLALHTRLCLGHWPDYGRPDPKDLPGLLGLEYAGLVLCMAALPAAALAAVALAIAARIQLREFPIWRTAALLIASSALFVVFCRTDPGGFLNWFFD